ncbi:TonB-dependent receptor domain-containing protein [Stappia sp.]|uniref:TonB-dependent receptor domain-containing protein n=1 Tax=Stappia sp. TaxID=1870903 RepID=UPI003A9961E7
MSRTDDRGRPAATAVACLAAALAFPMAAFAQDAAADSTTGSGPARTATRLKPIQITGDDVDVYNQPEAGSYVDGARLEEAYAGDVNEALRSFAGTFTRQSSDQPGITPNIRGLQGFGRVNSMIDGVPQTLTNLSGHGGTFDNFVYLDPNLLAGIDVARGSVAGAEGMGALAGAVNFRTLDPEDLLSEGKNVGAKTMWRVGTNDYGWSGMLAGAVRADMGDGGDISMIGAFSLSEFGHYDNGSGQAVPFDPSNMPKSGLFKVKFEPNSSHSLKLGGIWYHNSFFVQSGGYDWTTDNQTYTANYRFTPDNTWADLSINAYRNITDLAFDGTGGVFSGRRGTQTGTGANIQNISRVDLGALGLRFRYGFSFSHDDYEGNDQRGANPDGTLIKTDTFMRATASYGIFDLTAGLSYDTWNLEGVRDYDAPGTGSCPPGGPNCVAERTSRSGGEWNPSVELSARPLDWLQLYASYARTYRAPTASEMFYPGGHNFTGNGDPIQGNINLQPEVMWGLNIGANITASNLFLENDRFRLKLGYFNNRVDDYITYAQTQWPTDVYPVPRWVNLPGITRMQGFELEGGYDAGFAYANVSLTLSDTKQPLPYQAGIGTDVGRLPDDFATVDIGARFFDRKLTVGGRMNYVGDSVQVFFDENNSLPMDSYVLFDLYGSWEWRDNAKLFVNIENLTDKSYMAANSGFAEAYNSLDTGRGRTFILGASMTF